jgi:sugar lactone lactonase YvrE
MQLDTIKLEPVVQGFYLEALLVDGDTVWYGDVTVGGINRLESNGSINTWLPERRLVGGLLLNEDGSVLVSGANGIHWFNPVTNASGVLIDSVNGEPLKGVNEMRPDGKGGMYFGGSDMPAIEAGTKPGPVGLYRLDADRHATQLCDGLVFTNGLTHNRDGTKLFHNESFVGTFVYDILPDGSLSNRTQLLKKRDVDGMALDVEGNLWISGFGSGEILRMQPDGTVVQRIALPGDAATNVRFGGADNRDVYITVVSVAAAQSIKNGVMPTTKTSTLYRGRSEVAGQPIPRTRFRLG